MAKKAPRTTRRRTKDDETRQQTREELRRFYLRVVDRRIAEAHVRRVGKLLQRYGYGDGDCSAERYVDLCQRLGVPKDLRSPDELEFIAQQLVGRQHQEWFGESPQKRRSDCGRPRREITEREKLIAQEITEWKESLDPGKRPITSKFLESQFGCEFERDEVEEVTRLLREHPDYFEPKT